MKKANAQTRAKQQKSEKNAKTFLTVLVCLTAIITVAVVAVGAFTDVFSQKSDVKAVALVLSQAEEEEIEAQLSRLMSLAETGFDAETMGASDLLKAVEPSGENGLYASFGNEKAEPLTKKDPADRFGADDGTYKYYKIPAEKIDPILAQFDINVDHTVNLRDVYYYNGDYYFADKEPVFSAKASKADIISSKRVQDGRYYVTCQVGDKAVYVIVSKTQQEETPWKVQEISLEPIFDQLGIMIKTEQKSIFDYEMKTQVIEGKTDSGKVYCRYLLRYPVFYGKTAGETEVNRFYQSVVTYYTQQAQQSNSDYKKYIKNGAEESALPLCVSYSAEVTYTSDNYIAVCNEISETEPVFKAEQEENLTSSAVVPSKKSMECYIFEAETGVYVTKDSIIGKDYQLLEEMLYRIYYGYEYASLTDEAVTDSVEIPDDIKGLGKKIYASASTLSETGYMFCYIGESGYREDVIIPFGADVFEIEMQ